jgi:hypothetical protein
MGLHLALAWAYWLELACHRSACVSQISIECSCMPVYAMMPSFSYFHWHARHVSECSPPSTLRHDTVSERLRRWTRNPLGSARRGSNPLGVDCVASGVSIACIEFWGVRKLRGCLVSCIRTCCLVPLRLSSLIRVIASGVHECLVASSWSQESLAPWPNG